MRHEDATERGGDDDLDLVLFEAPRQLGAERCRVVRILQHEGRLQVGVGVEPRAEQEMTAQQRARLLVEGERVGGSQAISSRIPRAAAAGSGAAVIGRPTTR